MEREARNVVAVYFDPYERFAQLRSGNNCSVLTAYIGGLPFLFPVSNAPIQNGRELNIHYGANYWEVSLTSALRRLGQCQAILTHPNLRASDLFREMMSEICNTLL